MSDYDPSLSPKKELAYDLRQTVAQIVGEILMNITAARIERRYLDWVNFIDNFHSEISMKLTDKEEEAYIKEWNLTMDHIQKWPGVFQGQSQDPQGHSEVYGKIKLLEMWLRKKADKHDIFGSKRSSEGLS